MIYNYKLKHKYIPKRYQYQWYFLRTKIVGLLMRSQTVSQLNHEFNITDNNSVLITALQQSRKLSQLTLYCIILVLYTCILYMKHCWKSETTLQFINIEFAIFSRPRNFCAEKKVDRLFCWTQPYKYWPVAFLNSPHPLST